DQRRLASVAISDPAKQGGAKQDADQARTEHRTERTGRDAPVFDQVRGCKRDSADVVAVDQYDEERPDQELDVKRTQPAFVELTRDLYHRLLSHRFPLLFFVYLR